MEITQMLVVHSLLIKGFLGFLVLGVFIPIFVKQAKSFKKASFMYTMTFHAILTMIAFVGIVAVFTGDLSWEFSTILMVIVWAVMMMIEIKKNKLVKIANLRNMQTLRLVKNAFLKISLLQILLVVLMVVLMVLKAKNIIAI